MEAGAKVRGGGYHRPGLRDLLIAETLRLIEAGALDAVSLREVARRAGVSHAAVYRHFPDRAGLIAAVATRGMRALAAELEEVERETGAGGPADRIAALGAAYVRFATRESAYFRVMFARDVARKESYPELRTASDAAASTLTRLVDGAVEAGVLNAAEAREIALATWSLIHGAATLATEDQLAEGDLSIPAGSALSPASLVHGGVLKLLAGYTGGAAARDGGREQAADSGEAAVKPA